MRHGSNTATDRRAGRRAELVHQCGDAKRTGRVPQTCTDLRRDTACTPNMNVDTPSYDTVWQHLMGFATRCAIKASHHMVICTELC